MQNLDALRADENLLRKEIEAAGTMFRGKACRCPFHDDKNPSAGIYFKNGAWRFKCNGCGVGGDIIDIRAFIQGRTPNEELRAMNNAAAPRTPPPPTPRIYPELSVLSRSISHVEDNYADLYVEPDGDYRFTVFRLNPPGEKKRFIQASRTAGGWWMKQLEGPLPIANRTGIQSADVVVVVEGEKSVRALASVGITATTSPGGALKACGADWSPLAGKSVYLWPDFDEPDETYPRGKGDEHMRQVAKILLAMTPAPRVFWIDPKDLELPIKGDAADWVERYRGKFKPDEIQLMVEDLLADAEPMGVAVEYENELRAMIAGQRRAIRFGAWEGLTWACRALMPGKVTCVCGDGGSGKSLFLSDAMVQWYIDKETFAVYHLEDSRAYHMGRMHAQIARIADLTDPDWCKANGEKAMESYQHFVGDLEALGRCISEAEDNDGQQVTLDMLAAWVEARAKAGTDIIIIDPITAAAAAAQPWVSDLKFITKIKLIARKYGCRPILVTHPRTGTKAGKSSHNDMAGGAAYPRFAHSVLWLERNDQESQYDVRLPNGSVSTLVPNRILYVAKARNGPGAGRRIAFEFDHTSLRFRELGLIEKQDRP